MEITKPKDWQEKSKSLDVNGIAESVKKRAEAVCKNRKKLADELGDVLSKAEEQRRRVESVVTNIQHVLGQVTLDDKQRDKGEAAKKCCEALLRKCFEYEDGIRVLQQRFKNKKIKVISFGSKSQGKSSFTKAYTGLPDAVVSVKKGNNKDKTGATNIIIHKDNVSAESPEIYVVLKRKESILESVNECLGELSKCGLKVDGKTKFDSWGELYDILKDGDKKARTKKIIDEFKPSAENMVSGFVPMCTMLSNVFAMNTDFSEVNDTEDNSSDYTEGKRISLEELPIYNDMQYAGKQRYMTVSVIRIYVDLKHDRMFENIEICDTKGFSVKAGGDMWKSDLYKEIGNSDAAFSVQMVGQNGTGDETFYVDLGEECHKNPNELADLKLKHYALLNLVDGTNSMDFDNVLNTIRKADIYNTIYAGALKKDAKYDGEPLDMDKFVNYVIYDMMNKVVVSTQETDNNLMKKINEYPEQIRKLRADLQSNLSFVDNFETKDWDAYIKELIVNKIPDFLEELNEFAKKEGVVFKNLYEGDNGNEKNNERKVNGWGTQSSEAHNRPQKEIETFAQEDLSDDNNSDGQIILSEIYEMIAGDGQGHKKSGENDVVEKVICDAIEKVYNDAYNECIKKIGAGAASNIGAFIDDVSMKVFNKIRDNVNKFVEISVNGNVEKFRNELFSQIWKKFGLDKFYPDGRDFNVKCLENEKSELIKAWHSQYNDICGLSGAEAIFPRLSHYILCIYFKDAKPFNEEDYRINKRVVDGKLLKQSFVDAYKYHKFEERYMQCKKCNAGKRSVLSAVTAGLIDGEDFAKKLLELYKFLSPMKYVENLCNSNLITEKDKKEFENQKFKTELKQIYSDLISLSL